MRLLQQLDSSLFNITKDLIGNDTVPPYAILSHTWVEGQEVTLQDLKNPIGKNEKTGYDKLRFCAEQARRDGLKDFWVDTCCIDKSNNAELSREINSMFRHYRNASRCYVYLSDVSIKRKANDHSSNNHWDKDFRASRWFTRGWTLQELLAPRSVEFFSREGRRIGDRKSLEQQIHEITGIPRTALQGMPLYQFGVNTRLSWMQQRETEREEDKAYALLGIFDVYVAAAYGEGYGSALRRVLDENSQTEKCMQDLCVTDPRDDKKRIEDTKGGLLKDSYSWILENPDFQHWRSAEHNALLWVKGDPGKGKTMLLCGAINELDKMNASSNLLSYFFCQAPDARINNATAVLRGLIYMLVRQQPSLVLHLRKKYDQTGEKVFTDINAWFALREIFINILQDSNMGATFLVIDALDECAEDLSRLLQLITEQSAKNPLVKWMVSSRNWPQIEQQLDKAQNQARLSLELNDDFIANAVDLYIRHKLARLVQAKNYSPAIQDAVLDHLLQNAENTFLWVALVCERLERVSRRNVIRTLSEFPPGLNPLYMRMLEQINQSDDANLCKHLLATMMVTYRPIALIELSSLTDTLNNSLESTQEIEEVVGLCGSFLTIRDEVIYFVHQSVKDFLATDEAQTTLCVTPANTHYAIFTRSLCVLTHTLRRDIYDIREPGRSIEQVARPVPDTLASLRYGVIFWIDHVHDWLCISRADDQLGYDCVDLVYTFLKHKFLYWLEALSLSRSMTEGVLSIGKLNSLIQKKEVAGRLVDLVHDMHRFILSHKAAVENYPLQVYASALIFSPNGSLVRRYFQHEDKQVVKVRPSMADDWGACLQTLEGHTHSIQSVAIGELDDSRRIVSGSHDGTAKIWDLDSGRCLQTLECDHSSVMSVAIARTDNSHWVVTGLENGTVKIWDTSNGQCLQTIEVHDFLITSVAIAISGDLRWIITGSEDGTAKIWDASNGECLQTFEGHNDVITSVAIAISGASHWIISGSRDRTAKIWDARRGQCLKTLKGHDDGITSVAIAILNNSHWIITGSRDRTAKIWDADNSECLQTFEGHDDVITSVAIAIFNDTLWIATGSADRTFKIWDARNGQCLQTIENHGEWVFSVAISNDSRKIVIGSYNKTISIWDVNNNSCSQTLDNHKKAVSSVAVSSDLRWIVTGSFDCTVKIWDAESGQCLQTLKGHGKGVWSVIISSDLRWIVTGSGDGTAKIWDLESGRCLRTLKDLHNVVLSVAISNDSRWVVTGLDGTAKIWDAGSGRCLQTLKCFGSTVWSVAISGDSRWIVTASAERIAKIWDPNSGQCLQALEMEKIIRDVSFDISGRFVRSNAGRLYFDVLSETEATTAQVDTDIPEPYLGISLDEKWITAASKNMIWLPPEYRLGSADVSEKAVTIGTRTGGVWIYSIARGMGDDIS